MMGKSKVPNVSAALYEELRRGIAEEIRERLGEGELPRIDDGLYALGVFVHVGFPSWVTLYHQTQEGLKEATEDDATDFYQKWSPVEWGTFESIAEQEFEAVEQAYALRTLSDFAQEEAFREFGIRATAAAILALKDLEQEHAFGAAESRSQLTLISGQIDDEEVEEPASVAVAVRFLNPAAVATQYLKEKEGLDYDPTEDALEEAKELQKQLTTAG